MRPEEIIAQALQNTGNDRYKLSIIVAKRVEMLTNGSPVLVKANRAMKFADIALLEIAEGKIGIDGTPKA
ncbi:MAG: DNA-directed RNA polymerase subunit omega [Campylobacter sp.]